MQAHIANTSTCNTPGRYIYRHVARARYTSALIFFAPRATALASRLGGIRPFKYLNTHAHCLDKEIAEMAYRPLDPPQYGSTGYAEVMI